MAFMSSRNISSIGARLGAGAGLNNRNTVGMEVIGRDEQVDFKTASLHIRKSATPSTHPLTGRELRELRRHQRESAPSPFVFVSKRGAPLSAALLAHDRARRDRRPI
jgi:hypothetical protein